MWTIEIREPASEELTGHFTPQGEADFNPWPENHQQLAWGTGQPGRDVVKITTAI